MNAENTIWTSGDIRRSLAQAMKDVGEGKLSVDKGLCVAALAKEISSSMQAETNIAKVKLLVLKEGQSLGKITHLGKMVIDGEDNNPFLPELST